MQEDLPYIPYNSSNKDRAKENRRPMTRAEQRIRFEILQSRPAGYKFIRQKMVGSYILDFYCSKLLLGIEIDGESHIGREIYDEIRTQKIRRYGIKIVRYTNDDVFENIDGVQECLLEDLFIRNQEVDKQIPRRGKKLGRA